ncbi:MAG: glutamate--tRNA ligase [Mariprofundaceae bacterium]
MIITRFAPSPTGLLHLGNVRTALLSWLFARKHGGRFLLRFEDTDRDRSRDRFVQAIEDDLRWLGLGWDDEPLFQSAHAAKHQEALAQLAGQGLAYRCFCSPSQLTLDRKLAASRGQPPRYTGRCRGLASVESASRAEQENFVWRLAVHDESGEVLVHDQLRGDIHFSRADLDDPVVVRSDGSFTFLLPNAVDDMLDGVTHVLRGDDHLSNSAYQAWLLEALGHVAPKYLHHGLLLGADGAKLSKRTGSHSVAELRQAGLFPEALIQTMVRLGHPNMPDASRDMASLAGHFDAEHLSTAHVRWSDDEMWRWHARMLHGLGVDRLSGLLQADFDDLDAARLRAFAALVQGNLARVEDAAAFRRLVDVDAPMTDEAMALLGETDAAFFALAVQFWEDMDAPDWQAWVAKLKQESGRKGKLLFMPLRAALSGSEHGPEMARVVEFLGVEGVRQRLKNVIERT